MPRVARFGSARDFPSLGFGYGFGSLFRSSAVLVRAQNRRGAGSSGGAFGAVREVAVVARLRVRVPTARVLRKAADLCGLRENCGATPQTLSYFHFAKKSAPHHGLQVTRASRQSAWILCGPEGVAYFGLDGETQYM